MHQFLIKAHKGFGNIVSSNYIRINLYREDKRLLCTILSQILAYSQSKDLTSISLNPVDFRDEEGVINRVQGLKLYRIDGKSHRFLCASNIDPVRKVPRLTEFRLKSFELVTDELVESTLVTDLFDSEE
jgi:hypothetical protein